MKIKNSIALVTGANRGIGRAMVEALLEHGAQRVYATARNIVSLEPLKALDPKRIEVLKLDVTNLDDLQAVQKQAADITMLINNGITYVDTC